MGNGGQNYMSTGTKHDKCAEIVGGCCGCFPVVLVPYADLRSQGRPPPPLLLVHRSYWFPLVNVHGRSRPNMLRVRK